jgi:galactose mutarotase-like enzyme
VNLALLALAAAALAPGDLIVLRDPASGLEAAVSPTQGGELSSLVVRFRGAPVELLYTSPTFRGKAPLLWPAVGGQFPLDTIPSSACADGSFTVAGRGYPMPCHGFAQNLPWRVVSSSCASVTLELRDSERTRRHYPFAFRLLALYELAAGRLTITYTVAAGRDNPAPMPFSIGNHLSLRLPFLEGTAPGDMLFETNSAVELQRDPRGLVTTQTRPRSFSPPQRLAAFDASVALPLAGYHGPVFARLADPQGLALRVTHHASSPLPEPLVQFNVYGGPRQGFFCPEPWFGLQNSLNRGQGLLTLAPGADWRWIVEIQPEGESPRHDPD